jgi:glycosyltransferase involved in cell wall biosynthesis
LKLSAVLSIHNRGALFERALHTYLWQTLPAEDWEIVLVDDGSTEDLRERYDPYLGSINLRHVYMDHTRHAIFEQRNPGWSPGQPEDWFHTPALSLNIGAWLAEADTLCVCHPEVLHAPCNFECALVWMAHHRAFVFGKTYLGKPATNAWLERHPGWPSREWSHLIASVSPLRAFGPTELYWYTSFLPRQAFLDVGGVDFEYLHGVAGEDDDFRDRVRRAGYEPIYAEDLQGLHQDHSNEQEAHRVRDSAWHAARHRNQALYYERRKRGRYPRPANQGYDWRALECVTRVVEYRIGSSDPVEALAVT